jgi:Tfp pilus assembly protein PilO
MIRTVTPIFSIIIALVVFFFYTKPMFAEIKATQSETAEFAEAVSRAEELNAELSNKLSKIRAFNAESLDRLDVLVPPSINEVKVLTDLSEIARSRNMLFGNISVENSDVAVGDVVKSSGTQSVSYEDIANTDIAFSLIGTYDQFKAFLADVEQSLVMMEVTNITFNVGEGDLQQYELSVRLFALPPIE